MKGIILAGGTGSRLHPLTLAVNKQLLPVHDKPLIYYPLTTLISAGIKEICVISGMGEIGLFQNLLGGGSRLGVKITYLTQKHPGGIPEAFLIAEKFIGNDDVALILGDNIFVDSGEIKSMCQSFTGGASILGYQVAKPNRFGVIEFDNNGKPRKIIEKPKTTTSKTIVPGFYVYDNEVISISHTLSPSSRGEIEIADVNNTYLSRGLLRVKNLSRGSLWIDAGTTTALSRASSYISTIENNHGLKIGCPEEAALIRGFISRQHLESQLSQFPDCEYKSYLTELIRYRTLRANQAILSSLQAS